MVSTVTGFNVSAFTSSLARWGMMSPSKFMAYFPLPPGMTNRGASDAAYSEVAREINLWCDSASIPDIISAGVDVRRFGYSPPESRPVSVAFSEMPLTFIVDASGRDWQLFRSWMSVKTNFDYSKGIRAKTGTVGPANTSPFEVGYLEDYATELIVSNFDDSGTEQFRVIFDEAHPTSVSPIKMSWEDKRPVARFTVMFKYLSWHFDFSVGTNMTDNGQAQIIQVQNQQNAITP